MKNIKYFIQFLLTIISFVIFKLLGILRIDTAKEFRYIEQGNILNYVLEELSN